MSEAIYTEQELQEECLRRMRLCESDNEKRLRVLEKDLEVALNDVAAMKWVMRGIVAERANVTITLNAPLKGEEVLYGFRVFGEQAAYKLMEMAKRAFREQARMMLMRRHIDYLQNHARSRGLQFTELGENNDGMRDIFAQDFTLHEYEIPSIRDYLDRKDKPHD